MTTTSTNGNAPTTTRLENEVAHYAAAEDWLRRAEAAYREDSNAAAVDVCLQFAAVHAQLSVAADHDRLAGCVPDGASRIGVEVAGGRR